MFRLNFIKNLILDHEYHMACDLLEKNYQEQDEMYLLSLLYIHLKKFDHEKKLVDHALGIYPEWKYMRLREEWHNKPLFHPDLSKSKLVPRPSLQLERKQIPPQEVLNQLCFVSGANSLYFTFLIQLIESIQCCPWYVDIPIYIFDCGLTDNEKDFLWHNLKVKDIKDPGFPLQELVFTGNPGYKAIMNKPFLHKHFPDHKFYLWFDADCWIQDHNVIDLFLMKIFLHGCGVSNSLYPDTKKPFVATGAYGYNKNFSIIEKWGHNYNESLKRSGFGYGVEEITFCDLLKEIGFTDFLSGDVLHRLSWHGMPYIKNNDRSVLYTPKKETLMPIYAYDGYVDKNIIFWPTKNVESVENENWNAYLNQPILKLQKHFDSTNFFENQVFVSLYYRDWPESNLEELLKEAHECLS